MNNSNNKAFIDYIPAALFSIVLLLAPLFLDIKLSRPKLLVLETGLYGIFFLWLILSIYKENIKLKVSLSFIPLIAYGLASAVFYYFSPDKPVALTEFKRGVLSITAFFVASNIVQSEKQKEYVTYAIVTGGFLAILYGILQRYGGFWMFSVPKMHRVMSTFGNPIFFAVHIVMLLPVVLGFFFYQKKSLPRIYLAIAFICGLIALNFAQTRASYIALFASLIVFSLLLNKKTKTKIIVLLAIIILFGVVAILKKNLWSRHQEHLLIWRDTLTMWSQHPLTGTGPGTFHIYFPKYASQELKDIWPQQQWIVNDAHNEYVQYLSEVGVVGFGIFLWLIAAFFISSLKIFNEQQGKNRYLIAGFISSGFGILVQNFFSVDMRFIISAVYLFIVMGLIDSFNKNGVQIQNVRGNIKIISLAVILIVSYFSFYKVLTPYLAHYKVANTPDFFDEKVLDPAKTVDDLEALREKYPNQSGIYEKLGWVYAKEKNWPKAIKNYLKANELSPELSGPLNNLGNIHFLMGKRSQAMKYWVQSLKINPDQTDSRLNLARAYYYNGQLKEAVEELKVVLEMEPNNETAIVMLKQMVE